MKKIFSKFNRENDLKFQTETTIFIEAGKKFAVKKPLTVEAEKHIINIYSNYLLLRENFKDVKNVNVVNAKLVENTIVFEYAVGENLDKLILESVIKKNKPLFWKLFQNHISIIRQLSPITETSFKLNADLEKIFGNIQINKIECSNIYNIDLIFDNIFIDKDNNCSIIDYEWVFEHSFPVNYVIFRTISHFFSKYAELLNNFLSREEIYDFAGISKEEQEIYRQMEMNFQKYVFNQNYKYLIKSAYNKKQIKLKDLLCLHNNAT